MTELHELANERDPIIGNQDGTLEFKIPKRPIRKKSRAPGVHHRPRRGVLLPARPQRWPIPRDAVRWRPDQHETRQRKDMAWERRTRPVEPTTRTTSRGRTPGRRRFSIYWTWSYPWEANRDTTDLDNRFSTMTEVRRVAWPSFEGSEWDKMNFLGDRRHPGVIPPLHPRLPADRGRDDRSSGGRTNASTRQGTSSRSMRESLRTRTP